LFRKVGSLPHRVAPLFRKIGSFFRNVASLLDKLIRKLWLLPPCRRIDHALQKTWKRTEPPRYHFLPYVVSVLRVLGWAILIIGVLASILLGLQIMNGGLMVWNTELRGVAMGVSAIVLGIVGSFLAWLFLLVSKELVHLFVHVKENTRNIAERSTEKSG
jgi:membrane-anchored glycerophosphoryl diester phosphodiesterase (GDPDase)